MSQIHLPRRAMIKMMALSLGGIAFSQILSFSKSAYASTKKLIDMTGKSSDPANKSALNIAKGLNYVEDATAAEKAGKLKRVEKSGVAPKNQKCRTCQFYKVVDKDKSGECTLIPGVLVHYEGYCNSWVKAAALKPEEIQKL